MLDPRRLAALIAIDDHETVAAAAHALSLTPPAVSQQVSKLERQLGTTLLERDRGRVWLTDAGRELVASSRPLLDGLARAEARARQSEPEQAAIRLGLYASAMKLPSRGLTDRGVITEVVEADPERALALLRAHELDLVLGHEPATSTLERLDGIERRLVSLESLVLVGPAGAELSPRLAEHADAPWIVPGPLGPCQSLTEWAYRSAGFEPRVTGRCSSFESMAALVRSGLGLALIAEYALGPAERDGLEVCALTTPKAQRRIYLAARTSRCEQLDALVPRFQDALVSMACLT